MSLELLLPCSNDNNLTYANLSKQIKGKYMQGQTFMFAQCRNLLRNLRMNGLAVCVCVFVCAVLVRSRLQAHSTPLFVGGWTSPRRILFGGQKQEMGESNSNSCSCVANLGRRQKLNYLCNAWIVP